MTYNDKNFAVANKDASSGAEAYYVIIIFGLPVSRYKFTIFRHSVLHPLIWPQSEKKQRHSSVPVLSFDTEVEELNIATRADTMMTALSPPSSYSITNGRVWYQRLFPHQITLRPHFINCLYC